MTEATYAMMRVIARVMPSCKDISRMVSDGMDRRLSWPTRMNIRLHLSLCSLCRRYERQMRMLRRGAGQYADPDVNAVEPSLAEAAKQRLRESLKRTEE